MLNYGVLKLTKVVELEHLKAGVFHFPNTVAVVYFLSTAQAVTSTFTCSRNFWWPWRNWKNKITKSEVKYDRALVKCNYTFYLLALQCRPVLSRYCCRSGPPGLVSCPLPSLLRGASRAAFLPRSQPSRRPHRQPEDQVYKLPVSTALRQILQVILCRFSLYRQ